MSCTDFDSPYNKRAEGSDKKWRDQLSLTLNTVLLIKK